MSNELLFFILFGVVGFATGLTAMRIYSLVTFIIDQKARRKKYPYIESAHEHLLCKGPHRWDVTKLVMPPLPVDSYTVCTECGFISGESDWKLNGPALEVYRSHIKRRDERKAKWAKIFKYKQDASRDIMNKLIKNHVSQFGTDLSKNVYLLEQFFHKSSVELETLYASLNKELEDKSADG